MVSKSKIKKKKLPKKPLKKRKQYGGNNILDFYYNDKHIQIIGVKHNKLGITHVKLKKIVDYVETTRNICYLLELDKDMTKGKIKSIKSHGDFTTKVLIPKLKSMSGSIYNNLCIKGWDVRQSMIGQNMQNKLYNQPNTLSLDEIFNLIPRIEIKQTFYMKNKTKFSKQIQNYIEKEYKEIQNKNIFLGKNKIFTKIVQDLQNKFKVDWNVIKKWTINNINNINNTKFKKDINNLLKTLWIIFMKISDMYILQKILLSQSNYIIFVGQAHYDNLKKHLKALKII